MSAAVPFQRGRLKRGGCPPSLRTTYVARHLFDEETGLFIIAHSNTGLWGSSLSQNSGFQEKKQKQERTLQGINNWCDLSPGACSRRTRRDIPFLLGVNPQWWAWGCDSPLPAAHHTLRHPRWERTCQLTNSTIHSLILSCSDCARMCVCVHVHVRVHVHCVWD